MFLIRNLDSEIFKFYCCFLPRFPLFSIMFSSISLPKLKKIQTLAKIYQFLIELPGYTEQS